MLICSALQLCKAAAATLPRCCPLCMLHVLAQIVRTLSIWCLWEVHVVDGFNHRLCSDHVAVEVATAESADGSLAAGNVGELDVDLAIFAIG